MQEVYDTERHLLDVACTRARDHLLVTSVDPADFRRLKCSSPTGRQAHYATFRCGDCSGAE